MTEAVARVEQRLQLSGLKCASCAAAVERALRQLDGVAVASVSFGNSSADVTWDPARLDLEQVIQAVQDAGFAAAPAGEDDDDPLEAEHRRELRRYLPRLLVSAPLAAVLMLAMLADHALSGTWQLALAAPVYLWGGWPYHLDAWRAVRRGRADMNVLISLGSSVAFAASVVALVGGHGQHLYFDTAAMIIAFILVGRYLEAQARRRTTGAVRALLALRPRTARLVRDGAVEVVDVAAVVVGDQLEVLPGESFPVDGVVVDGTGAVDESAVTGESRPVVKQPGEEVVGATLNLTARLRVRATAVGAASVLGRMIALVRQAQGSKAPIQRLADRVAARFVPAVVVVAGLTFVGWLASGQGLDAALSHAVAVLIIACPCALGLATPTAIMVGAGRGARLGVLVKGGVALETAAAVDLVAFDKTGTLTRGTPTVVGVEPVAGWAMDDLLRLAAAAEAGSTHPYAQAVVRRAEGLAAPLAAAVEETAGEGVAALVSGRRVTVGRPTAAPPESDATATPLAVTVDGDLAGWVLVADEPREEAAAVVAALHAQGVRTALLSGDDEQVVAAIAARLGLDEARGRLRPEAKQAALTAWRQAGRTVAMVGDGINDAPALAAADLGLALGSGTEVALEAGDVALLRADLRGVLTALALSRAVLATIRGNLAWAFGYNLLMIPLAAGLLNRWGLGVEPLWAAAAMALSSVSVVANSLRLHRWHPPAARP